MFYLYCKRLKDGFIHLSDISTEKKTLEETLKTIQSYYNKEDFIFWIEEVEEEN